ncbi:MAG: enolase C-terminal domain-like protein [Flavobacteriales bacterium]
MALRIKVCPYRLLFKHPFGTAHGLRDGTDALFVQVEEDGTTGHGEITLPPYVQETVSGARQRLRSIAHARSWTLEELLQGLDMLADLKDSPATRAGLHSALIDALARKNGQSVAEQLGIAGRQNAATVMTIGICTPDEAIERLHEFPPGISLKLKAGDPLSISRISAVIESADARILIDGNKGLKSVSEAARILDAVPSDRLIGIEQPFGTEHDEWNRDLNKDSGALVIADESLQGIQDLERVAEFFDAVNIKLMKCGGLDRAAELAMRADALDLRVMLGCMSESSLGCGTMAQLASEAQILDLDGPWLLKNDPWEGLRVEHGGLVLEHGYGVGVEPQARLAYSDA